MYVYAIPRSRAAYTISTGKTVRYRSGEPIGSTDQDGLVLMVVKGYIKRYMIRNDGSLGVQILYGPEDVFSLTRIFHLLLDQSLYDGPETYYYEAIGDVTLFSLDASVFADSLRADPTLYRDLFSEAGHHLKACVHSIENISLHTTYFRVAHQLFFLLKEFGRTTGKGTELQVALTHQDLADMLGVTRATVSLAVGKLREKQLLLPTRLFTAPDLEALHQEAYSS